MAFHRIARPAGTRTEEALSADNAFPDRFTVIDILRRAGPALGLRAPVIATVDALLSCLPPKRSHHTVFASNETLSARLGGTSERTLRRHFAILIDAGLLRREDSPNRKRYVRRDSETGLCLRFGFDLRPLFARVAALAEVAEAATRRAEHLHLLRQLLRLAIGRALARDPEHVEAQAARRLLRCAATPEQVQELLGKLPEAGLDSAMHELPEETSTSDLAGSDGHFVRHHQNRKKESKNLEPAKTPVDNSPPLTLGTVLNKCPEPLAFAEQLPRSWDDVIRLGSTLAPMIGVTQDLYQQALRRRGALETALAIWILVSRGKQVRSPAAYFRALTLQTKERKFQVWDYFRERGAGAFTG